MKLQQLIYFKAACQYGSISKAAEELHISQPSISMAIRSLENEFSVKLIERRYQGFSLTEDGKLFLNMADGILRHTEQVERRMSDLKKRKTPIRLGVPPMAAITLLPQLYEAFLGDIAFQTEENGTNALFRGLKDNTLDMAFVTHDAPLPADFVSVPVMQPEIVWCVSKAHPLSCSDRISFHDLAKEPLVLFKDNFYVHELVAHNFHAIGVEPNVLHVTQQLSTMQRLIQSGAASGFLMRSLESSDPNLAWISLSPPLSVQVSLAWERSHGVSKDMKKLIDYFQNLKH